MRQITLGNTGITVSELCFGALPIGPSQKGLEEGAAAKVIGVALEKGVTFVDTAQMYKTYGAIRRGMALSGKRPVISTKSVAETRDDMERAVEEALAALGVARLDIFLLHAARVDTDVFERRAGALARLLEYKAAGVIGAVGISTHSVPIVRLAAGRADMDVVFPLLNETGMGILNGGRAEMEAAIEACFKAGKGVFLMKALAGGNLIGSYERSIGYCRAFADGRAPIALGMVSEEEVTMNVDYFDGLDIAERAARLEGAAAKRFVVLKGICKLCGACEAACHSGACRVTDERAEIDDAACLKCGYCVAACKQFAIRMV